MSKSNPLALDPISKKISDNPVGNMLFNPVRKDSWGLPVGPGTISPGDIWHRTQEPDAKWFEDSGDYNKRMEAKAQAEKEQRLKGYWGTVKPGQRPIVPMPFQTGYVGPFNTMANNLTMGMRNPVAPKFGQQPWSQPPPWMMS